ncbi:MAG: prepilin-type N-terminal cleavage/methylation domain-containing protein, partial [candidate division NC10 bacterium]|nr:prepilin-type N-terminal cleavage/methylation domain-containing protein [candidate division NC10 bacterium]
MLHRTLVRNRSGRKGKGEPPQSSGRRERHDHKYPGRMIKRSSPIPEWSRDMTPSHPIGRKDWCRGFTLVELLIVIAMIATLSAIGIPVYATALGRARVTKAIADIHTFDREIQVYQLYN